MADAEYKARHERPDIGMLLSTLMGKLASHKGYAANAFTKVPAHDKIVMLHKFWLDTKGQTMCICRQYFLYMVLTSGNTRYHTKDMSTLSYFDYPDKPDGVISTMSYAMFIDKYAVEKEEDAFTYDLSMSGLFVSHIEHPYPYLLKSVLDRVKVYDESTRTTAYCILKYDRFAHVKHVPQLTSDKPALRRDVGCESDTLTVEYGESTVTCTVMHTEIRSTDRNVHGGLVAYWEGLLGTHKTASKDIYRYAFALPDDTVKYHQVVLAVRERGVTHEVVRTTKIELGDADLETAQYLEITADTQFLVQVADIQLKASRTYTDTLHPYCRISGDTVLTFFLTPKSLTHGDTTIDDARQCVQRILRWAASRPVIMQSGKTVSTNTNISILRTKDHKLFGQDFCRCVPPRSQPIWVDPAHVDEELAKGKIVIVYNGNHYTTKDREVSGGMDYIGFINTVASQKTYTQHIIRTYRRNHLDTTLRFRQIKDWALDIVAVGTTGGKWGKINRSKVLLPLKLQHLYDKVIYNPAHVINPVMTKKTTINRDEKVTAGELPDYLKTMLGNPKAYRRVVLSLRGNKLLEACNVTPAQFNEVVELALATVRDGCADIRDLDGKTEMDVIHDLNTCELDHRLYGKVIERVTGYGVLVFTRDGIVPYRYSHIEADRLIPLYLLPSGKYDLVVGGATAIIDGAKAEEFKAIHNVPIEVPSPRVMTPSRDVDYTLVCIALVSHLSRWLLERGIAVEYELVHVEECKRLCESVYRCNIPEERHFKLDSKSAITDGLVVCKESRGRSSAIYELQDVLMLHHLYREFVSQKEGSDGDCVLVKSPVDMSQYTLFDYSLEDSLYPTLGAYMVDAHTEIVRHNIVNE